MRNILLVFALLFCVNVYAGEIPAVNTVAQQQAIVTPQHILFENCTKIFSTDKENLYYLTLASIAANRFQVDEVQTSNGYVIFTANRNKYLATVAQIDKTNSILKITPCNNIYNFPPGIILNTFKYIELSLNTPMGNG